MSTTHIRSIETDDVERPNYDQPKLGSHSDAVSFARGLYSVDRWGPKRWT